MCALRSVQIFSPFCSDVHSALFRCSPFFSYVHSVVFICSVRSVRMFSPFCSDAYSVLFICSLRSVQMFIPFCSDVQSVLLRCLLRSVQIFSPFCCCFQPVVRPTAADSVQLLSTGRRFTTSPLWPLPFGSVTQDGVAAVFSPRWRYALPHLPLCVIYVARSNAPVRANASSKLTVDWTVETDSLRNGV